MKRKKAKNKQNLWEKLKNKAISVKDALLPKLSHCIGCHDFWQNAVIGLVGLSLLCPSVDIIQSIAWGLIATALIKIHEHCWQYW